MLRNGDAENFSGLFFRRGHLIAVEAVNRATDFMAARKLLVRQSPLSPMEAERSGFDLKAHEIATR